MAIVRPFRALRYTKAPGSLEQLVAPPYDVIDAAERARLQAQSEANAIHLILPSGDRPYDAAAELLRAWQERGWLATDAAPAMLVYAQRFAIHGQTSERFGLLGALKLEPLDGGVVLPHEKTLEGPKEDRLRLVRACRANLSPIFGMVDAPLDLQAVAAQGSLEATFTDRAGVAHRLWRVTDEATLRALSARLAAEQVFIADGHHRYTISLAYRDERRAADGNPSALRNYDFVLAYLCSTRDPGLVVLPTHRVLRDAPPPEEQAAHWRATCRVETFATRRELAAAIAARPAQRDVPCVGVTRREADGGVVLEPTPATLAAEPLASLAPALRALDVTFLHQVVLPGIAADRFTYTHDEDEALAALGSGAASLVALVPPPRVDDVLSISRAGLYMPQKSTYFHPKVLTGLAFRTLDGDA